MISRRAIFLYLVQSESHYIRVDVKLQTDCLSVEILADKNRLLKVSLKLVSAMFKSVPGIWNIWTGLHPPPIPSLHTTFLTTPLPDYWSIIKNTWQYLRAVGNGFNDKAVVSHILLTCCLDILHYYIEIPCVGKCFYINFLFIFFSLTGLLVLMRHWIVKTLVWMSHLQSCQVSEIHMSETLVSWFVRPWKNVNLA